MNLYKIMFDHYSQKDSERGIVTYLISDSEDSVYNFIKSEPQIDNIKNMMFNSWGYYENKKSYNLYDEYDDFVGIEDFKERMLRLGGQMFDEDEVISDRYYGVTMYGWELQKENLTNEEIEVLVNLKIADIFTEIL